VTNRPHLPRFSPLLAARALVALFAFALCTSAFARVRHVTDPDAPRALPEEGSVSVSWSDPAQFSDLRYSGNRSEARRGNWVVRIAEHLRKRAELRLPAGEQLQVEITDIKRAGNYEPWRGIQLQDVRIVREIYPPRIELRFRRTDASGRVLEEGERELVDHAFLIGGTSALDSDPLRYEKAMIDRWLRREFEAPRT
jgi:hypothetical protein